MNDNKLAEMKAWCLIDHNSKPTQFLIEALDEIELLKDEVKALEIVKSEMHNYRNKWLSLQEENTRLRAVLKTTIHSVDELLLSPEPLDDSWTYLGLIIQNAADALEGEE